MLCDVQPEELNGLLSRCAAWEPGRQDWTLRDCINVLGAKFDRKMLDKALQAELADLANAFSPLCQNLVRSTTVSAARKGIIAVGNIPINCAACNTWW